MLTPVSCDCQFENFLQRKHELGGRSNLVLPLFTLMNGLCCLGTVKRVQFRQGPVCAK